ncbi:MAG: hypothetical protein QXH71_00780 [Candidatus Anstonellaceae archaeon]
MVMKMKDIRIGGIILCLFFATGLVAGFGPMGGGLGQAALNQTLIDKHMEFMNAMHSGNFELAKQIAKEYNFGPRWLWDEQEYNLHVQLYKAYKENDQQKIQQIKNQLFELNKSRHPLKAKSANWGFGAKKAGNLRCSFQLNNPTS